MKKNKSNIICAVICIIVTLAPIALAAFGVVKNNIEKKDEEALNEQQQGQQMGNNYHETSDDTDTEETKENTEPEDTIPSIKDNPKLPDVQGKPNIDVSEMTRNPDAEVVDSKIEYGTKEADSNEK